MTPVIETKRTALAIYQKLPSQKNLQTLKASRKKRLNRLLDSETTSTDKNLGKIPELRIQAAAILWNNRGMYDGIKKALEPAQIKTTPLMS